MTAVETDHLTTMHWKLAVDTDTLAWHWGTPLHKVKNTVQRTTQHGVTDIANLTLSCIISINDQMLQNH